MAIIAFKVVTGDMIAKNFTYQDDGLHQLIDYLSNDFIRNHQGVDVFVLVNNDKELFEQCRKFIIA